MSRYLLLLYFYQRTFYYHYGMCFILILELYVLLWIIYIVCLFLALHFQASYIIVLKVCCCQYLWTNGSTLCSTHASKAVHLVYLQTNIMKGWLASKRHDCQGWLLLVQCSVLQRLPLTISAYDLAGEGNIMRNIDRNHKWNTRKKIAT